MSEQVFADGIANVSVTGGVVRIDFDRLAVGACEAGLREHCLRLVIPLEGFVQACNTLEQVVRELQTRGVLQRQPDVAGTAD